MGERDVMRRVLMSLRGGSSEEKAWGDKVANGSNLDFSFFFFFFFPGKPGELTLVSVLPELSQCLGLGERELQVVRASGK